MFDYNKNKILGLITKFVKKAKKAKKSKTLKPLNLSNIDQLKPKLDSLQMKEFLNIPKEGKDSNNLKASHSQDVFNWSDHHVHEVSN